ncbi:MAG: hypothetical protein OHK0024_21990 [Thalassobaculales bacterium]
MPPRPYHGAPARRSIRRRRHGRWRDRLWLAAVILAANLAVWWVLESGPGAAPQLETDDKLAHALAFAAATIAAGLVLRPLASAGTVAWALGFAGLAVEVLDGLLPGGTPDYWDFLANQIGVGLGLMVLRALARRR